MTTKTDEKVLCVSRYAVELAVVAGDPAAQLEYLLTQKTYRNRHTPNDDCPPVEEDNRYKQLIPYIVVVNDKGQILAYNRGWKGGEDRLKGRWAIGFGGHVNDQDADWLDGLFREIREELDVPGAISHGWVPNQDTGSSKLHGPIGFINDDSDDVGRHHLGVVYVLRADDVTPKENPKFGWYHPHDFDYHPIWDESLESWAVLALPMVRAFLK